MSDAALLARQDRQRSRREPSDVDGKPERGTGGDASHQSPANFLLRFAGAISWIGHLLIFISLAVGVVVALRLANRVGLAVLLTLLVCVILPMALLLFRGVRSGRWSDADVSVRMERTRFYPSDLPEMLTGTFLGLAGGIATGWWP
jgi:hypothetical protein